MSSHLEKQHVPHHRIAAVVGKYLSDSEFTQFYSADHPNAYYKTLSRAEVACYLSHRRAWQAIIDNNLDFAIILEDDVELLDNFTSSVRAIADMPADWDYIKLAEYPLKRRPLYSINTGGFSRVIYNKVPARTCAQAVSRAGAMKLLRHSDRLFRPIDIDLQYWWEKDINVFGLLPYPVQPLIEIQSDIDQTEKREKAQRDQWKKLTNMWHFYWQNRQHTRLKIAQRKQHQ